MYGRTFFIHLLMALIWQVSIVGCNDKTTCLPVPPADDTPPHANLHISYIHASSGRLQTVTRTHSDPDLSIEADASSEIKILYSGSDTNGLRSLQFIGTRQKTVSVGIEREAIDHEPVESRCPVLRMERSTILYPHRGQQSFNLAVMAENWVGQRAFTGNVYIRLHFTVE